MTAPGARASRPNWRAYLVLVLLVTQAGMAFGAAAEHSFDALPLAVTPTERPSASLHAGDQDPSSTEHPTPVLRLGEARYRGHLERDGDIEAFRGVPFAAPPVGERRWAPPADLVPAAGDHDATAFAPVCLQGGYMSAWYRGVVTGFGGDPAVVEDPPESEDCLYLNLWRPADASRPLPVVVFIHGGGNTGGWSWEPNYHGARLAAEGVVVITIAYRLGVFGFFAHPEQAEANFGLLDQVAALRWIHAHADALGIDPERVTVMGESSGGNNILHLAVSPLARGLFRRASVQSAGWALQETPDKRAHEPLARALEARLGIAAPATRSSLAQLRAVPADALFDAARVVFEGHGFDPVVDGHSITEPAIATVNAGRLPPIDLVIGSNADEWRMYLPQDADLGDWSQQGLPEAAAGPSGALLADARSPRHALDRAVTAWNMVCPSLHFAQAVESAGGRSYVYWFTRQRDGAMAATMGAYHGAELPYLFDTHDAWLPTSEVDRALTRTLMTYWARFARSGNPNGSGQVDWPRYRASGDPVLRLDRSIETLTHPERALCAALGVEGQRSAVP